MSINRIKAMLLHEFFITKRTYSVINDIVVYPMLSIIIFGFLTLYLTRVSGSIVASYVLMGIVLWQVISITQYSISVGCLWDVWAKNLTNIFISPISIGEYLISYTISGTIKALIVIFFGSLISYYIFHFNLLNLGIFNLFIFFFNLVIFAFAFGIFILGLLFRFGNKIQALSWSLITFFQPLMAVIYPVSVLPQPLRSIAYLFPPTYIFESARMVLSTKQINWTYIGIAFILNCVYCFIAILFFKLMYRLSKESGEFAKLEL